MQKYAGSKMSLTNLVYGVIEFFIALESVKAGDFSMHNDRTSFG